MGKIRHDLLPKLRPRKCKLKVDIDLYPYAQELYNELSRVGIIDRIKHIPQLGVIKVPKNLSKTRYDYCMLQLYLHQLIKKSLQAHLRLTYNNYVKAKELRKDYQYNSKDDKPSIGDVLQLLTIAYNIGHFHNTFTASRAVVMIAIKDVTFKEMLLSASPDQRYKNAVDKMLEERNYQRLHLINSILILEKCDMGKQSVSLAIEILYAYLNQELLSEYDKLAYAFNVFKTVRTVSYMAYDLQIANTPLTIDLCNEDAMKLILQELLSEYNDTKSSERLVESISKLLDDTVYNENSNAICYYGISCRMVSLLSQEGSFVGRDYYSEYFVNQIGVLNRSYSHKHDFVQEQILKLTFASKDRTLSGKLLSDLERINNTRVGYYDRHTGERTILVSIKKSCEYTPKVISAFKSLKCIVSYLRSADCITPHDIRYLLCTKFFLFYFMGEKPIVIKPTVDNGTCVICVRGKNRRVKEITALLNGNKGNEDVRHETQFMLDCLKADDVNDTSICIPASILVYQKNVVGKHLCEFDGMVIHPMRKQKQIIFFEAKNTVNKPSYGKRCLEEKLDKLSLGYDSGNIKEFSHDAMLKYTL
ncbi:MAG: hypothetical protein RR505_10635 [Raoultibacter sp.]